jgi:hypothetical protein
VHKIVTRQGTNSSHKISQIAFCFCEAVKIARISGDDIIASGGDALIQRELQGFQLDEDFMAVFHETIDLEQALGASVYQRPAD